MGVVPSACATPSTASECGAGRIIRAVLDISSLHLSGSSFPCLRFQDASKCADASGFAAADGRSLPDAGEHGHGQANGRPEAGAV